MTGLDAKFGKVLDLMRSTTHEGERDAARVKATAIAARNGMTLDQAIRTHDAPQPTIRNIFDGFDDWMEAREPGHKARKAAEKSEKERQRLARAADAIARHGSEEAVLAPCWREQAIHDALGPLRKTCRPPHHRWTDRLDGYDHLNFRAEMPAAVRQAIETAYPLPTTFKEAKLEHDYWLARRDELEDVLGPEGYGDDGLDLVARLRANIIRDLVEKDIPVTTLADFQSRFVIYASSETDRAEIRDALLRDLNAMVQASPGLSTVDTCPAPDLSIGEQIRSVLRSHPELTDREVARRLNCSPTTVGKARRTLGLTEVARSVQRGGQTYRMNPKAAQFGARTK